MTRFEARVIEGRHLFTRNVVVLAIREGDEFLMPDGTWTHVEPGASVDGVGIELPAGSIEAIAVALAEYQGHTSQADTEARVLREWLAVEMARVDKAFDR